MPSFLSNAFNSLHDYCCRQCVAFAAPFSAMLRQNPKNGCVSALKMAKETLSSGFSIPIFVKLMTYWLNILELNASLSHVHCRPLQFPQMLRV